ncbi:MAG: glucokinase [Candidatus Sedimenticola sp. (ex Thyasira tokunagai)]
MATTDNTTATLIADIGGTNARFALWDHAGCRPTAVDIVSCEAFSYIGDAIEQYLSTSGMPTPTQASIALAATLSGDQVTLTNGPWSFSTNSLRRRLGLERLLILNDFTALAMSLPYLADDERLQIGGGDSAPLGAKGIIGPGTGLGVSGLIATKDGEWLPLQGEGGHVTYAPITASEVAIIDRLQQRFGHVSAERIVSGQGLENIHLALREINGEPAKALPADEISRLGIADQCPICRESLTFFCAVLGTVAGNLALTLGAHGGIYIGGGIPPKLGRFFLESPFRERFERHGRFTGYLERIPCYLIDAPYPALTGAAQTLFADLPGIGYSVTD